ncbi:MAG TPA: hypothetical protein PLB55_24245, partial [Prosthecobacter sp.]|nr:hypothetical protein [Prosthecobacter sp.]
MKPLIVIILAIAVGYVAYEYVYPPLADAMKFTKPVPPPPKTKAVAVVPLPHPFFHPSPPFFVEPRPDPRPG